MREERGDDIVALIYPDFDHAKEVFGLYASDEMLFEKLGEEVEKVNGMVQTYKRINMVMMRHEEFPKNSSRKIKRIGLAESVMEDYLYKRG